LDGYVEEKHISGKPQVGMLPITRMDHGATVLPTSGSIDIVR